ncbi:hypothetical protein PLICRDRAFT_104232, partial [Plicaturopsis crispa FD-325 SS-3]
LQVGATQARGQDTCGIKKAIIHWVLKSADSPTFVGRPLIPMHRSARGFNNYTLGGLLCPAELDWEEDSEGTATVGGEPVNGTHWMHFMYAGVYNPKMPWVGLLKGQLLIDGFLHVFIAPSSVNASAGSSNSQSTCSGNAQIHWMTSVTIGAIAYIVVQIRFALLSATTFNRGNKSLDLVNLYNSVLDYFANQDNQAEGAELLQWWNQYVV